MEPYLTASTVIATAAQRLIRTLCADCREPRPLTATEGKLFGRYDLPAPATICEPAGCPSCAGHGYRGRTPVMEIVEVDAQVKDAVREGRSEALQRSIPLASTL